MGTGTRVKELNDVGGAESTNEIKQEGKPHIYNSNKNIAIIHSYKNRLILGARLCTVYIFCIARYIGRN